MTHPRSSALNVDGSPVNVLQGGKGKRVLYLHDELSSEWNLFLDALSEGSDVTSIEMPGFGTTARPPHIETVADIAFLMADVLDQVAGGERVALAGGSVGGWIALETAVLVPHLLSHLILIGSPGLYVSDHTPTDYFVMTPDERSSLLFERPESEPKVDEDSWIRNSSMTARLVWQPRYVSPKLKHRLNRLRQPSLVLWGEQDRFLPSGFGSLVAKELGATFQVIPDAGHFPVWDVPDETASGVLKFLEANV